MDEVHAAQKKVADLESRYLVISNSINISVNYVEKQNTEVQI
jgi:hypothetical protein